LQAFWTGCGGLNRQTVDSSSERILIAPKVISFALKWLE
jgi:hypothetical protein